MTTPAKGLSPENAALIETVDGWILAEECDLPLDRVGKLIAAARAEERARIATLEAENLALRAACQPFVRAWALGRRSFRAHGNTYETASRSGLGLSEDGSLQVGDFERLDAALTTPDSEA